MRRTIGVLIRVAEAERDRRSRRLADALTAVREVETQRDRSLAELHTSRMAALEEGARHEARDLRLFDQFAEAKTAEIRRLEGDLIQLRETAEGRRAELTEAMRDLKVYERHRDRLNEEFAATRREEERRDLDEIAIQRHNQR